MSSHFETYVNNLKRRRMVDLIDRYGLELQRQRALAAPTITGSAYDPIYVAAKQAATR